jgi:uncharacterized protein YeaO (DUF488 family)
MEVRLRRVYDPPAPGEGTAVLVDRLWPRGVPRERASWQAWHPDVAPSTALRKWYGHEPARFAEFERRYREELATPAGTAALERLRALATATDGRLTLVTASRDPSLSQAEVLRRVLLEAAG